MTRHRRVRWLEALLVLVSSLGRGATPTASNERGEGHLGMARLTSFWRALPLLLAACSGRIEQDDLGVDRSCIYGGAIYPAEVALDPGQRRSVAAVYEPALRVLCSAVLVAEGSLLTAKHCLSSSRSSFGDVELIFGPDAYSSAIVTHPTSVVVHSGTDAALLQFDPGAIRSLWPATPVGLYAGAIDQSLVGHTVEIAGFGQSEDSQGLLKFASQRIVAVDPATVTVDTGSDSGACFGDSGGPALIGTPSGPAVVGILAWGPDDCKGGDHYVRADLLYELAGGGCGP